MSKKKSSTMTLRDFHGGSIPSELPLPSAPGMVVERKSHERPGSGGWMGSSLHRAYSGERVAFSRQGSGNFPRSYEDKTSYLPNPANIGRNYDEDERKPVDGHSRRGQNSELFDEPLYEQRQVGNDRLPERYVLDNRAGLRERYPQEDSSQPPMSSSTLRSDSFSRRASAHQDSSLPFVSQDHTGFYSTHVPLHSPYLAQELGQPWRQGSLGQQPVTPGTIMGSGTGVQNVWTARKEGEYGRSYPSEYTFNDAGTVHTSVPRVVQASALEKVSSRKWNSRMPQSPNESQAYAGDYGQTLSGLFEGGGAFATHDSSRYPAEYDRAIYAERATYGETGRSVDSLSLRDGRINVEKVNLPDSGREFAEGRGVIQPDAIRYMDDRHPFSEVSQKGFGTQREAARFVGSRDSPLPEPNQSRLTNNRLNMNEAATYSEPRSTVQGIMGWGWPELSPRREYGEVISSDSTKGLSSEYEKRGFSSRDTIMDRDVSVSHRPHGSDTLKERSLVDSPYNVSGREDLGYLNSPHSKSRDDYPQEVSDTSRTGRIHDRSRGSDIDQNHPGLLLSPGRARTPPHDSTSAPISTPVDEGKGTPVERPKLKLLPRTKPMQVDSLEDLPEVSHEDIESTVLLRAENVASPGSGISAPIVSAVSEEPVRTKLSLKPRSQPVDFVLTDSGSVKERMSLFGGARPRELVLKERGVDESVIVGADLTSSASPSPMSAARTPVDGNRTNAGGLVYGNEKQDKLDERNRRVDQYETRTGRQDSNRLDRLDSRSRRELTDADMKEERRGPEHRLHLEKRESDRLDVDKQESWRRPAEVLQSPVPGGEGSSGGAGRPIQSAAELAQAFSRSTSFGSGPATSAQGYAGPKPSSSRTPGLLSGMVSETPGLRQTDVPFSRLTEAVSPGPQELRVTEVQAGYRRTSAF